ncbi:hypothetical protein PENARI_c001G04379 [Penicillium arizonense]|uniref:Uncharacterized protein n=1 Tax=Penicillium arizonense TaxID=1835702 RepID=A0A1F5LY11_PENAI|nr:hypothetical protein PENARI_c001G04379 [Penicillium arizonense]OGE57926.1 hypothetical protein PENARI_c001G04379 [Penicillium arizonense]
MGSRAGHSKCLGLKEQGNRNVSQADASSPINSRE